MKKFVKETYFILQYILRFLLWNRKFRKTGIHSIIRKPLRILGGGHIEFGDHVNVMQGLRIEALDRYKGKVFHPNIKIGDHVSIGQFSHIISASEIDIQDYVSIGPYSMINDCRHGYVERDVPLMEQNIETEPICIGEGTIIGMSVCVLPGVKIGKHCYIGANCVVSKNVPDNSLVSVNRPRKVQIPYNADDTGENG